MIAYVGITVEPGSVKIHAETYWVDSEGRLCFGREKEKPVAIFEKGAWLSIIRTSAFAGGVEADEAA